MAVVKSDYATVKYYKDTATCKANGATVMSDIQVLNDKCLAGTSSGVFSLYTCVGSKLKVQFFSDNACLTKTSDPADSTANTDNTCEKNNRTFSCSAGSFSPPAGNVYVQFFTTNKCDVPQSFGYVSQSGSLIPDNGCIPVGNADSAQFKCSSGTTTAAGYTASNTCSGNSPQVTTLSSGVCGTVTLAGNAVNVRAMCSSSSGASSTSITILSFVLLVLATFSSTM